MKKIYKNNYKSYFKYQSKAYFLYEDFEALNLYLAIFSSKLFDFIDIQ